MKYIILNNTEKSYIPLWNTITDIEAKKELDLFMEKHPHTEVILIKSEVLAYP